MLVCIVLNRIFGTSKEWFAKYDYVLPAISYLKNNGIVSKTNGMYDQINLHMLQRSLNQANEACNKLWFSVELLAQIQDNGKKCSSFNENFLTSAIPTLHYANISAIVSLLSLFGICSWAEKTQSITFYNIIRTSDYIHWKKRSSYLHETFGNASRGWHLQVLQTYFGLMSKGIKLPDIDLVKCKKLLVERNRFDYDILGQTSMKGVYGLEQYRDYLPTVMDSVSSAVEYLQKVILPLPNGCDSRFKELELRANDVLNNS